MDEINRLIEEEIQRRVNLEITTLLETISETFDIKLKTLLKLSVKNLEQQENVRCAGLTKSKTRCKNMAKKDGYCMVHQNMVQKPVRTVVKKVQSSTVIDESSVRGMMDCFTNGEI